MKTAYAIALIALFAVSATALEMRLSANAGKAYENPDLGPCSAGEENVTITGVKGAFCSPKCTGSSCPAPPAGSTAQGECVLEPAGSSKPTMCALICQPSGSKPAQDGCPKGATCKAIQGVGICTYP